MKLVITKCLDRKRLAMAIRAIFSSLKELSIKETFKIIDNLPYSIDVFDPQEAIDFNIEGLAEFHFEKTKEEQREEAYQKMMELKSTDVINWYNNLSKEDKARVDFMMYNHSPRATA